MGPRKRRRHRLAPAQQKKEQVRQPQCQIHPCANCSSPCVDDDPDPCDNEAAYDKLTREIPIVQSLEEGQQKPQQHLTKVYNVLTSIYKLDYLHQLTLLDDNRHGGEKLLVLDNKKREEKCNPEDDDDDDKDIGVCLSCAENLTYLYSYYHQFTRTTSLDSFLSKKIKKLNDVIHRLETRQKDNNYCPPPEISEVRDPPPPVVVENDSDNNDYEDQTELNCDDDNGHDEDYNILDFSHRIKLESIDHTDYCDTPFEAEENEGVVETKSFVKKCNTEITTTTTTIQLNTISNSLPFVKLCGLTEAEIKAATKRKDSATNSSKQLNLNRDMYNDHSPTGTDPEEDDQGEKKLRRTRKRPKIIPKDIDDSDVDFSVDDTNDSEEEDDFKVMTPVPKTRRRRGLLKTATAGTGKRRRTKTKDDCDVNDGGGDNRNNDESGQEVTGEKLIKKRHRNAPKSRSVSYLFKLNCDDDGAAEGQGGTCVLCNEFFGSVKEQYKHVKVHVGDFEENSVQTCPLPDCSNNYSTKTSLLYHIKAIHCPSRRQTDPLPNDDDEAEDAAVKLILNCTMCPEQFESVAALYKHVLIHIPDFTEDASVMHPCPIRTCVHSYGKRSAMIFHVRSMHCTGGRFYDCPAPDCQEVFTKKDLRRQHMMESHWPSGQYYCSYCVQNISTEALLKEHESNSCPLALKAAPRNVCPATACQSRSFNLESELANHLRSEHAKEKLFKCTHANCVSSFQLSKGLRNHVKRHHTTEYKNWSLSTFRCRHNCSRKFTCQKTLARHEEKCTGKKMFQCDVCKLTFSQWYFRLHMRRHFEVEPKTFVCQVEGCGKTFMSKSGYWGHQVAHKPHKHLMCEHCGKVCTTPMNYKSHLLIHGEEKKHLCTFCGKTFLRSQGLKKHLRVHSDQKQFECSVSTCRKIFPYIESLNHHIRIAHTPILKIVGQKPPQTATDLENPPPLATDDLTYGEV